MKEQSILVADSDPKNLQILKDHLENAGFLVTTVTNGWQAWELVQQTQPTLILSEVILPGIDGMKLLEKITSTPQTKSLPLIFLTSKRELQDKVLSFKMGAKDYLVKPLHVKEVIAHIKMVLARLERQEQKIMVRHAKVEGDLAELDISALIENFGVERKTGVLSVTHSNGKNGQIYFQNGCVINAEQGNFKRESAVYQMFNWSSGHFSMVFRDVTNKDEIATSNLGLLLQGLRQQEMRKHYLQQIPDINAPFLPTSTFKSLLEKRKLSRDLVRFISLLDGKRKIQQILDSSTYDEVRTLELILRLTKQGFIKQASGNDIPLRQPSRPSAELPGDEILTTTFADEERPKPPVLKKQSIEDAKPSGSKVERPAIVHTRPQPKRVTRPVKPRELQDKSATDNEPARLHLDKEIVQNVILKKATPPPAVTAKSSGASTGLIVFIGDSAEPSQSILSTLTDGKIVTRSFNGSGVGVLKVGSVSLENNYLLNLVNVPVEGRFDLVLASYRDRLSGYVLVVDCLDIKNWEYIGYMARMLHEKYAAPFFLITLNLAQSPIFSTDVVKDRLQLDAAVPVIDVPRITAPTILNILEKQLALSPSNVVADEFPLHVMDA